MSYDGVAWNETVPTNATIAHELDDVSRDVKIGVRSRLAIEHVWPSSQAATSSAGYHTVISLLGQTSTPSLPVVAGTTQSGIVYANTAGALLYRNTDGVQRLGILEKIYPVGGIYISTLSDNPEDLLGFGTWEAFGAGRVLVGKAASGTFDTGGATGGTETHQLTIAEMPAHAHTSDGSTLPSDASGAGSSGSGWGHFDLDAATSTVGDDDAHNNLQPYVVVYMWKRTV